MRDWREEGGEHKGKLIVAIGAAFGLAMLAWMRFAGAGDEKVSSSGFVEGGAGGVSSPFASERRAQTGLTFVRLPGASPATPSSVKPETLPGPSAETAAIPAAPPAPSTAAAAAAPPAPAAPGAPGSPDPKELAAAGVPTDAAGLARLGAQPGLLSAVFTRLLDHPKILGAVLNNKLVVDALMNRETSKRNCSDTAAVVSILSTPNSGPAAQLLPYVKATLARPETAAMFASSELGNRLMSCPSVQGLSHSPAAIMGIVAANPEAIPMVTDPRVAQALTSSVQGQGLLGIAQSVMGGGSPP